MSKFNFSVYLNAYNDNHPSNNPSLNNFKWNRDINSMPVNNASSGAPEIVSGETQLFFSGIRTLLQDGTTEYSIALAPLQTSTYILSWAGGTAPNFRTPRAPGADATTQIFSTVNGTTVTFSSPAGLAASFVGTVPGLTTSVTITATNLGTVGNSVSLTANGTSTLNTLISNWNTANPSNTVALTTGNGSQIPSAAAYASFTGIVPGTVTPVTITAAVEGAAQNSIVLIGDGTSNIDTLISNWNTAYPSNQVVLTTGDGTQVPNVAAPLQFSGGINGYINLSGGVAATQLALISGGVVVGDYVTLGSNFAPSLQGTYQIISLTATSFTIVNAAGVVSGPINLGSGFASQLQIFSAAGVQVGDTLVISGGFSPVSWGSYTITAVYAESVWFSSTGVLPQEGPIMTQAITIYDDAKSFVYIESDQPLNVIVNGVTIGNILPIIVNSASLPSLLQKQYPGIFALNSTIWSVSVQNTGLNTANVFWAAIE